MGEDEDGPEFGPDNLYKSLKTFFVFIAEIYISKVKFDSQLGILLDYLKELTRNLIIYKSIQISFITTFT